MGGSDGPGEILMSFFYRFGWWGDSSKSVDDKKWILLKWVVSFYNIKNHQDPVCVKCDGNQVQFLIRMMIPIHHRTPPTMILTLLHQKFGIHLLQLEKAQGWSPENTQRNQQQWIMLGQNKRLNFPTINRAVRRWLVFSGDKQWPMEQWISWCLFKMLDLGTYQNHFWYGCNYTSSSKQWKGRTNIWFCNCSWGKNHGQED